MWTTAFSLSLPLLSEAYPPTGTSSLQKPSRHITWTRCRKQEPCRIGLSASFASHPQRTVPPVPPHQKTTDSTVADEGDADTDFSAHLSILTLYTLTQLDYNPGQATPTALQTRNPPNESEQHAATTFRNLQPMGPPTTIALHARKAA